MCTLKCFLKKENPLERLLPDQILKHYWILKNANPNIRKIIEAKKYDLINVFCSKTE